jgi:hypothetical protein
MDVEAHRHPDRELALVVGLVGVELGPGRIADDPQPVGDVEPAVPREREPAARVDPVVLETEVVEGERAADGEQDGVALGGGPVVEVDDIRPVRALAGPCRDRPDAEPDVDAVAPQELLDRLGVAGMLGRHQPAARLDDRHRDAEPDVDLRQLAACRPAAEDEQALRQLASEGRLAVRPDPDAVEAGQRRPARLRPDGHDHVRRLDLVGLGVVADLDAAAADDPGAAAVADRARPPRAAGRATSRPAPRRPAGG